MGNIVAVLQSSRKREQRPISSTSRKFAFSTVSPVDIRNYVTTPWIIQTGVHTNQILLLSTLISMMYAGSHGFTIPSTSKVLLILLERFTVDGANGSLFSAILIFASRIRRGYATKQNLKITFKAFLFGILGKISLMTEKELI